MPQPSLDVRRARRAAMTGQRERLVRPPGSEQAAIARDGSQQPADANALALRRRQLELLKLTG